MFKKKKKVEMKDDKRKMHWHEAICNYIQNCGQYEIQFKFHISIMSSLHVLTTQLTKLKNLAPAWPQ